MENYLKPKFSSHANPLSVLLQPNIRVSVLTDRLLRIEFDPDNRFENRPSQAFWYRDHSVPEFCWRISEEILFVETDFLALKFRLNGKLTSSSLTILIKQTGVTWHYGDANQTNLKGTYRTLDETQGKIDLEMGLNALSGWSVVDDTTSLVFDEGGWLVPREANSRYCDLYFFGYGHDYLNCIYDFQKISGAVPLLPRWALGCWWSRFWAYSDKDLISLMDEFKAHSTPLSVCIIDMDWHITKTGNKTSGWTGYTWNNDLFPEPENFLFQLHDRNLHTALNLHPAEGIHPHEASYLQMAEKMGIDTFSGVPVAFDCADDKFMEAYFSVLHHPMEEQGVDFWWLDWQQGKNSSTPGLDPLFMLNHLHALDIARSKEKRGFIFSRWPGLGGHRYPIGFSGDTIVSWDSLAFQPYFTATAANVAYGWWSHDIGGHMGGIEEAELYLRWVQYGVFSPIFRLHSTKNAFHERRPWAFDAEIEKNAIAAMQLRRQFIPYIYSAARKTNHQGLPLISPIYFYHPSASEAYQCPSEYYFGEELIAAPFTQPRDEKTLHSRQVVWLPEGIWFDFFTGEQFEGGLWYAIYGLLTDIPIFAKAGAIIPMDADRTSFGADIPDCLEIRIFAGKDGEYILYEDDGETQSYLDGKFSEVHFELSQSTTKLTFNIHAIQGDIDHLPSERSYKLKFYGVSIPDRVVLNGADIQSQFYYDEESKILSLNLYAIQVNFNTTLTIESKTCILLANAQRDKKLFSFLKNAKCPTYAKSRLLDHIFEYLGEPQRFLEIADNFSPSQILGITEIIGGGSSTPLAYNVDEAIRTLYDNFFSGNLQ